MDFEWNDSQKTLRTDLEAFLKNHEEISHTSDLSALEKYHRNFLGDLVETGYPALAMDMNNRTGLCDWLAGAEFVARMGSDVFVGLEVTTRLFGGFCKSYGKTQAFAEVAESVAQGKTLAAVAVSDPAETTEEIPAVTVEKTSDGWNLTGVKPYVTNAPFCDKLIVSFQIENKPAFALVDRTAQGVKVGERQATLGYENMAAAPVTFENVAVSEENLAGPFNDDKPLAKLRETEDLVLCVAALATMDRAFAAAKNHALSTKRNDKKLIKFQEISFKLAEIATQIQGGRQTLRRVAWLLENGEYEAAAVLCALKVFLAEAGERVASDALQVMAGKGYMADSETSRCYRDAKFVSLAGTTSERARMAIADHLLDRHGS